MKSNTSPTTFIIALIIAGAGIYWYFFTGTGNEASLTASNLGSPAQTQFQTLVSELTPISFNTSIFSDAHFTALVDISTPVAPDSVGRLDPFAAITGVGGK